MEKYFVKLAQISIGIFLFAILSTQILSFKSALADNSANKFSDTTKQSLISGCTVDFPKHVTWTDGKQSSNKQIFQACSCLFNYIQTAPQKPGFVPLKDGDWQLLAKVMQDSTQLTAITDTQKRSLIQIYSVGYILVMGNSNVVACTKKAEQQ